MMTATLILLAWMAATGLTVTVNIRWFAKFVSTSATQLRDPDAIDPVEVIGLPRTWR